MVFVNINPFGHYFFSPLQTISFARFGLEKLWVHIWNIPEVVLAGRVPENMINSLRTITEVERLLLNFAGGMLLGLSGMIFQNVFRNPMAAPTMLGVSNGINIAWLIITFTVGVDIYWMPWLKYGLHFGCAGISLLIVMVLAKLAAGHRKMSVNDLLLVGISFSAVAGGIVSGIMSGLDEDMIVIYRELAEVGGMSPRASDAIVLIGALIICIVPMLLIRFSFNTVTYGPDDMRGLGINSGAMRFFSLVLGTFMMVVAMVQCGAVGMISLSIPHISRLIYGSEFRRSFVGNMVLGGAIMMLCRSIADLIPFVGAMQFPMGVVVNVVITPVFAFFMARMQKQWQD